MYDDAKCVRVNVMKGTAKNLCLRFGVFFFSIASNENVCAMVNDTLYASNVNRKC